MSHLYIIIVHNYYRPKYAHVAELHCHFTGIPIAVLTATATPPVQAKLLGLLINPVKEIASVNKPNVAYIVKQLQPLPKGTNHTLASLALLYCKCIPWAFLYILLHTKVFLFSFS